MLLIACSWEKLSYDAGGRLLSAAHAVHNARYHLVVVARDYRFKAAFADYGSRRRRWHPCINCSFRGLAPKRRIDVGRDGGGKRALVVPEYFFVFHHVVASAHVGAD